jgi:AraC family transcriptional regulator
MDRSRGAPIDRATSSSLAHAGREPGVLHRLPQPILSPVIIGPATLIRSSAALPWRGILLEKYTCSAGERPAGNALDRPVLVMLCSAVWRGEHREAHGPLVPTSKRLGALTVVPKGTLPAGRSFQETDVCYCAFEEEFLSAVRGELDEQVPSPAILRSGLYDRPVSGILNLLLAEMESGGATGTLYGESLAHALAVRFLYLGHSHPAPSDATPSLLPWKLRRIQEVIEDRLGSDLTLPELAAEVGLSRSHFLRAFRASTGLTPHRYLLKRRIERARRLLPRADLTIAEVADVCGFSNPAHLTVAFRKECGMTPAEYRRHL